jgi:hypothetical protein
MQGHPTLLESHLTAEFLYYAFYHHFTQLHSLVSEMMKTTAEEMQQRGAELACIAYISPVALESDAARDYAKALATMATHGSVPQRRGAARVYAQNLIKARELCEPELSVLLDDDDRTVLQVAGSAILRLRIDHLVSLRGFLERYAVSRAVQVEMDEFTEYLLEHGLLDPEWTLTIIDLLLDNIRDTDGMFGFSGGGNLIRLVARLYNDPTADDAIRQRAMDLFDRLMARFNGPAQAVLAEWDRR